MTTFEDRLFENLMKPAPQAYVCVHGPEDSMWNSAVHMNQVAQNRDGALFETKAKNRQLYKQYSFPTPQTAKIFANDVRQMWGKRTTIKAMVLKKPVNLS